MDDEEIGTGMSNAEWQATAEVRAKLAKKVGLLVWIELSAAVCDEAVRREAGGADGAAYAWESVRASGRGARGGA